MRRAVFALLAVATLVVGVVGAVVLLVLSEERAGHAGQYTSLLELAPVLLLFSFLLTGIFLGQAVVPGSVIARGRHWTFSGATGLAVLAAGLAIPTPMALFTWPLSALAAIAAVLLFRLSRRAG
jgi:hypothetical protein